MPGPLRFMPNYITNCQLLIDITVVVIAAQLILIMSPQHSLPWVGVGTFGRLNY